MRPLPSSLRRLKGPAVGLVLLGLAACHSSLRGPPLTAPLQQVPLFEAHSGFWLSLHHVLYEQARRQQVAAGARLRGPPSFRLSPEPGALTAEQQQPWSAALAWYAEHLVAKDLLFDSEMTAIKQSLAAQEHQAQLEGQGLPAEMVIHLNQVASIYRATGWPEHDAANRAWLAAQAAHLREWGPDLARELSQVLGEPWPSEPIRVDLVPVASWAGAYTTVGPLHVTLATLDPRTEGLSGLETIFHEASHGLAKRLREATFQSAQATHTLIPRDLWHALLFMSAGPLVQKRAPGYVPYAEAQGLFERVWVGLLEPIRQQWLPHVEGRVDLESAVGTLVSRLSSSPQARPPPSGNAGGGG